MSHRPEDLASTLTERTRSRRIAAEKRISSARTRVVAALRDRLRDGTVKHAWLIGSSVWGDPHDRSDIDVVVEGLSLDQRGVFWDELSQVAEMDIDLLHLEELEPRFRARVLAEGIVIHSR